ncbi:transmembrane receptor protein [Chloropicon primus]|uniref:Transmembrane receptor protein n=1 Tax=Chloropicon primus TaxID=1764295 RepID=A0A5B8MJB3_9CHLO|nr:transmembrane receptor protein [Chloropicon primus]|eukprot:QDZ20708.1 transmembrane receptor protein [Chloropicon primus]
MKSLGGWKAWLVLVVVLQHLCVVTHGAIHKYNKKPFRPYLDALVYGGAKEGMRATRINQNRTDEIIEKWSEHPASGMSRHSTDGLSYIRFEGLKFLRPKEVADKYRDKKHKNGKTGLVQILLFEVRNLYDVGHVNPETKEHTLCCTKKLSQEIGCTKNSLILQTENENQTWPKLFDVHFNGAKETVHVEDMLIDVEETGLYNLWFITCHPDLTASQLWVSGTSIWKNPTGFLPGMMLPLIPLYGVLSLCYLFLGFVWLVLLFRNFKDVIMLQVQISVVLLLSMLETSLWYFDYVNFNNTGSRPAAITMWAVLFGALRKVISKVVLLLVCMGYGVVKPTLGQDKRKILLLTAAYLGATILLDTLSNVGTIDDISDFGRITILLPVAALDGVIIVWVFSSLTKIINKLQNRNQVVKLTMYSRLYKTMVLAAGVSLVWMLYEMYFRVADAASMQWQSEWVSACFWKTMTLALTAVVCVLWSPSKVSARYAYSEQLDGNGEDNLELCERSATPKNDETVFSLEDEDEEAGKLE